MNVDGFPRSSLSPMHDKYSLSLPLVYSPSVGPLFLRGVCMVMQERSSENRITMTSGRPRFGTNATILSRWYSHSGADVRPSADSAERSAIIPESRKRSRPTPMVRALFEVEIVRREPAGVERVVDMGCRIRSFVQLASSEIQPMAPLHKT